MRGECVNVGLVVFGPTGTDVRMPEVRKLRHLTGHSWDGIADAYAAVMARLSQNNRGMEVVGRIGPPGLRNEVFSLSKPGELVADTDEQYEAEVRRVLFHFVDRPVLSRKEKQKKINSEISSMLKQGGLLASRSDTIDDGKVVANFVVSEDKAMVADFAYKPNGLKIVSTLELRGLTTAAHGKACEKGATLFFAKERFGDTVRTFGVYAASESEVATHRSEIEILTGFADGNSFNWMVPSDRQKFRHALY